MSTKILLKPNFTIEDAIHEYEINKKTLSGIQRIPLECILQLYKKVKTLEKEVRELKKCN